MMRLIIKLIIRLILRKNDDIELRIINNNS